MPPKLRRGQLLFLAAAVFVVSLGYGGLMPVLPEWLAQFSPIADAADVARHVGYLSGAYAAGVLVGAPLWGYASDRIGASRILIAGMVGYVASLVLLWVAPQWSGLWVIYALRTLTGLCVAAVVPVVTAIVAAYTPRKLRARRFAWLGAISLLGFLFGPALNAAADLAARWLDVDTVPSADLVIAISAGLGAAVMFGLALTLPPSTVPPGGSHPAAPVRRPQALFALLVLSGAVMFVLSGFEVGIVLQGQQHLSLTTQQVSLMFAGCSLVMLAINALLFFTSLLDKAASRSLIVIGMLLGLAGMAILAVHQALEWMYLGISLTAAGAGLVLPVISYLAAGTSPRRLGATMGAIAAASGLGQVLGSAAGGWMFGEIAQSSFAWLALPLVLTLSILILRPRWARPSATDGRVVPDAGGHAA